MRYLLFEDSHFPGLFPVALMRPVFELICGREGLRKRVARWFPGSPWGVRIRPWLHDVYKEEHPHAAVNDEVWLRSASTLLINGRWLPECRLNPEDLSPDVAGFIDGSLVWIRLDADEAAILQNETFLANLLQIAAQRTAVEASGRLARHPWDLVEHNGAQLIRDFADEGVSMIPQARHVECLGSPADVYISPQAEIDPYVVIDARHGPVSVDRGVAIQSFTRLEGPCHIGAGTRIFRGLIREATTIGEICRVGGEIESSVLHSFVNKYHEGFLGHSYVCPWVNLGAMTTTSDLRSDYGSVRVPLRGTPVDSGINKVGSFIGDHSRTAIDSMFNTGSSVGVMSLVLPGGRLLPRHIPSFCNISFGELADDWPLENSITAARTAMERRGEELTPHAETLIRYLHQMTADERSNAINRRQGRSVRG